MDSLIPTEQQIPVSDLRETDILLDKSGNQWRVFEPKQAEGTGFSTWTFWLGEPVLGIKQHLMSKPAGEKVTVLRQPDANAIQEKAVEAGEQHLPEPEVEPTPEQAEQAVAEVLGGQKLAETTPEQEAAATRAAVTGEPVALPTFASMTPLEARTHLYLLHGIYGHDVPTMAELTTLHDDAHEAWAKGTVIARYIAHTHGAA